MGLRLRALLRSALLLPWILYFIVAGVLLLPYPGIENDEALFAGGIYTPDRMEASFRVFDTPVCTMIMSYIGALKAWLYTPVFLLWRPSPISLRLPVILCGALTVWLFARFLKRVAGRRAAVVGCALLATDCGFLLTTTFDWGPAALQHLLLVSGMLMLVSFYQERRETHLAAGFFLLGLALWNKAIFVWMLSGAVVAAAIVLHREIRRALTARRCVIAAGAFLLGTFPLVVYNLGNSGATFRNNEYSLNDLYNKTWVLGTTMKGNGLAGVLVRDESEENVREPETAVENASLWLSNLAGRRITGFLPYALLVAAIGGFWAGPHRRALLFFLVAFAVAWLQMLITSGAGGSVHHTILLWPFLHGFIAVALAGASQRIRRGALLAGVLVGLVAGSNMLVTNEHLARLVRFGPGLMFTDAVYPLSDYIRQSTARQVYAADWGMGDTLKLLLDDKTALGNAIEPFSRLEMDASERRRVLERMARSDAVFVGYTQGNEMFPAAKQLLLRCAREAGFRREVLEVVRDRNGRPIFEVYRFRRQARKTPDPGAGEAGG